MMKLLHLCLKQRAEKLLTEGLNLVEPRIWSTAGFVITVMNFGFHKHKLSLRRLCAMELNA
jgi:hypothetical protein